MHVHPSIYDKEYSNPDQGGSTMSTMEYQSRKIGCQRRVWCLQLEEMNLPSWQIVLLPIYLQ
eukprot:7448781-Ditylum_brightwellii.AAC.1